MRDDSKARELEAYLQSIVSATSVSASFKDFKSFIVQEKLNVLPCPVIVVGGTNGKGSSVQLLQSIYASADYAVASFTSPHLFSLVERFQLNREVISESTLFSLFQNNAPIIQDNHFNYFQALTYVFFIWLKTCKVDVIILEVGLGGRLDPVNAIISDVVLITNVALDHWQYLGKTREAIAKEKSGLLHENSVFVYGESDVPQAICDRIQQCHAKAYQYGRDYTFLKESENTWCFQGKNCFRNLPYPFILLDNAVNVLMVVDLLQHQLPVSIQSICKGLACEKCLGRGTFIQGSKNYYFDVAHNEAAIRLFVQNIQGLHLKGQLIGLAGFYQDKLSPDLLRPLSGVFDKLYVVDLGVRFGEDASSLLSTCMIESGLVQAEILSSLEEAWEKLEKEMKEGETLAVLGSFQTVSFALRFCLGL